MATLPPPGTAGEVPLALAYKTWVLKVSIHCEGCKKKVQKILHSVEGVHSANIDTKLQKVIVIGNVEAETLIRKLEKSGKHAELWPEMAEQKEKKPRKSKKKEKSEMEPEANAQEMADGGPEKEKSATKVEVVQVSASTRAKNSEGGGTTMKASDGRVKTDDGAVKCSEGSAKSSVATAKCSSDHGSASKKVSGATKFSDSSGAKDGACREEAVESKSEGKKPDTGMASTQSPAAEKKGGESGGGAEQSGGGSSGKKKELKKGRKPQTEGEPSTGGAPAATAPANHYVGPPAANLSHHQWHEPQPHRHCGPPAAAAPPPPVYAVSYNMAYPTSSSTASYYASPLPHSYSYTHPGPDTEPPPPSDSGPYPRQPLDSFELFSDENPNGCFIM